jgi:hypothetical protein
VQELKDLVRLLLELELVPKRPQELVLAVQH